MKKIILLAVACMFLSTGCAVIDHNVQNRIDATDINFANLKKGTDCQIWVLGLFPLTDSDIDQAAKEANIKKLKYVEYNDGYYILFSKSCVVVYGE